MGHIFPVKFVNGEIILDQTRNIVTAQNSRDAMWCVREIAHNTIAVGFFDKFGIEIYEGQSLTRCINLPSYIFALILPPVGAEAQDTTDGGVPPKIIAMDNQCYWTVDLTYNSDYDNNEISWGSQCVAVPFCNIRTGIGGFMPRYVPRLIEDQPGNFALTAMIQGY